VGGEFFLERPQEGQARAGAPLTSVWRASDNHGGRGGLERSKYVWPRCDLAKRDQREMRMFRSKGVDSSYVTHDAPMSTQLPGYERRGTELGQPLTTVDGAASYLRVSRWQVYHLIRIGELVPTRVGARIRLEPRELLDYVQRHRGTPPEMREPGFDRAQGSRAGEHGECSAAD
jgi:excisionase family DNA binding protein